MASEMLQKKWCVILSPLPYLLCKSAKTSHAAACLHNYVINEDYFINNANNIDKEEELNKIITRQFHPPLPLFGYIPTVEELYSHHTGASTIHGIILYHLHLHSILCPSVNIERN